jgi:hypothetical protein
MKSFFLFLILSLTAHSEILRLSQVVHEAGEGITKFEISYGELKEMIFVKDQPIVTTADVATAQPTLTRENALSVSLTEDGGKKMFEATKAMRHGVDRIAIIVDGKVKSAPIVQSILAKNFEISGLEEPNEPQKLAARMSGKSEDEIAKIMAKNEKLAREHPPRPELVFHTDEEYKQLKTEREKMGLHYMDRVYTETELDQLLKQGMSEVDVIAIFGKPFSIDSKEKTKEHTFLTAPEKHPAEKLYHMDSFIVEFTSEKVTHWRSFGLSDRTREPKRAQRIPENLIQKVPPVDLSAEDFDIIAFVEKYEITLKPNETTPTKSDYHDLLSILWLAAGSVEEDKSILSTCDVITLLKPIIPDLDALVKNAPKGRIAVADLKTTLQPYVYGDKTLK